MQINVKTANDTQLVIGIPLGVTEFKGIVSAPESIATTAGALLGTSTTTTYVENAAGVAQGGRSGLTALVVGGCFLIAMFFSPLFLSIPSAATAPTLIFVGLLMAEQIKNVDFDDFSESIPAFVCMLMMPLTYSISNGNLIGMITYVLMNMICGKFKKLSPAMNT